jgi:Ser/Thr protein kinase RdoA (MazF antagonist)
LYTPGGLRCALTWHASGYGVVSPYGRGLVTDSICRFRVAGPARVVSYRVGDIIGAMATEKHVRSILRTVWHLTAETCEPLVAVSDSRWSVTIDGERYLVRITPDSRRAQLLASLSVAEALETAGIVIGRPVRTANGALSAATTAGDMALLSGVSGRPLDATDPLDQQWWGDLLGRAHKALLRHQRFVSGRLASPELIGAHLNVAAWLRPALAEVVQAVSRLMVTDQLTYGVLHGDPRPDGFHLDIETGATALSGWGAPLIGPLVYDVAVAVRYAGGIGHADDLVDGYVSAGPVGRDELTVALPVMLRLHWALVADEHARTLAVTGSPVPLPRASAMAVAARRDALEEARQALADLASAERAE